MDIIDLVKTKTLSSYVLPACSFGYIRLGHLRCKLRHLDNDLKCLNHQKVSMTRNIRKCYGQKARLCLKMVSLFIVDIEV
jgi:hypothetical protein